MLLHTQQNDLPATTESVTMSSPIPTQPAPALDVPLVGGGRFVLADETPDRFTMVVFYRGLHCPVCRSYAKTLEGKLDALADKGVEVVMVSMDAEDKAREAVEEWKLDRLRVAHGLSDDAARAWGLHLSKGINDGEPDVFSEPGLFLVRPDSTVYYTAINSMPFGRPNIDETIGALGFVIEQDYPARGEMS